MKQLLISLLLKSIEVMFCISLVVILHFSRCFEGLKAARNFLRNCGLIRIQPLVEGLEVLHGFVDYIASNFVIELIAPASLFHPSSSFAKGIKVINVFDILWSEFSSLDHLVIRSE